MTGPLPNRVIYGKALVELGEKYPELVVLDADISKSTNTFQFARRFPKRFFNMGAAEQNMIGIAAGLATTGKLPFASTFAMFAGLRASEQVRTSIACPRLNVKIVATNAGIEICGDGVTHQATEDLAVMRAIPNVAVVSPSDPVTTRKATLAIIATGHMVEQAVRAAEALAGVGIHARVLDCHTIKPIDAAAIAAAARETCGIVTVEDHNTMGGLGSAVCEVVAELCPTRVLRVGVQDCFASSGRDYRKLLTHYGLDSAAIVRRSRELLEGKTA